MKIKTPKLQPQTQQIIRQIFQNLDYARLGSIYCDEGGEAFWDAHQKPCERIGITLATQLKEQVSPKGRSLYVGAGVAEIPSLIMEITDLKRQVVACNLRNEEVEILNQACQTFGLSFQSSEAQGAQGTFDHIWIVSVLNDPEEFPELSALSYGRANPVTFDINQFNQERNAVLSMSNNCLKKLKVPGLVTTSVEEIPWVTNWCEQEGLPYSVGDKDHPTAIVKDPICFIKIG